MNRNSTHLLENIYKYIFVQLPRCPIDGRVRFIMLWSKNGALHAFLGANTRVGSSDEVQSNLSEWQAIL